MGSAKFDIAYVLHVHANLVDDQADGEVMERGANEIERLRLALQEEKDQVAALDRGWKGTLVALDEAQAECARLIAERTALAVALDQIQRFVVRNCPAHVINYVHDVRCEAFKSGGRK